jgi:hypothetical protein
MKKIFLFLAVFMATASAFAVVPRYEVHFTSSCGRAVTYSTNTPFASASLTAELQDLNAELCPSDGQVRIIYNP